MKPARLDLEIKVGSTFDGVVLRALVAPGGGPYDLTGCTPIARYSRTPGDANRFDLSPTIPTPLTGEIFVGPLSDEVTALRPRGDYVWDLYIEFPGGAIRGPYCAGKLPVTYSVSIP